MQSFLLTAEQFSSQQKLAEGVRTVDGLWSARLHLLGFCLLARARTGLQNYAKETRIGEAIRCFFRFFIYSFSDQYVCAPFSQRCLLPLIYFLGFDFHFFVCCIGYRAASGLGEANEALQALFVGTGYQQSLPGMLT